MNRASQATLSPNASKLAELRVSRGWTQDYVADQVGVCRSLVANVESGRSLPSLTLALALAKLYGEPVEQLWRVEL